ncbi:MAG TPA: hypothetical protein VGB79_12970 [Allosphingosinicella sp.]
MKRLIALFGLAAAPIAAQMPQPPSASAPAPAAQAPAAQGPAAQAPAAQAQQRWAMSDTLLAFVPARLAVPRRAGALEAVRHFEASAEGQGIDNGVHYQSADREMSGRIYIYQPGLPHAGLAAIATGEMIRATSPEPVDAVDAWVADAGGARSVAIRTQYRNYQGRYAVDAAFVKAGRWIVKINVTGPAARAADVRAAIDAMLAGIRWGVNPPRPAQPIALRPCAAGEGERDARPLADPPHAEIAALGLLATFDGGGIPATENGAERNLPSRIPAALCLSSYIDREASRMPILRGAAGEPLSIDGRTRLVAMLNDNGMALEVVHAPNFRRFIVMMHRMGETHILGGYDGVPSDRQVADLVYGRAGTAANPRVTARFPADGAPAIYLPAPPPAPPPAPAPAPASPGN